MGLNHAGPYIHEYFSIANTTKLLGLSSVESLNVEESQILRAVYKLNVDQPLSCSRINSNLFFIQKDNTLVIIQSSFLKATKMSVKMKTRQNGGQV